MKFSKIILPALLATASLTATAQQFDPSKKLGMAEYIIENFYVDTMNVNKVVEQGIVGMLKELDPHSTFTNAEETKALTEPLNGNFSGIGIQFQLVQDTVYVIQTVAGGPSEKVGIIPGDRIVAANDTVIAGKKMPNSAIMKRLRGPKGSIVNLKVVRRSEPDTLVFRVKRDDIPLYTVDAAYMAAPGTGYVRISSFGATTHKEFKEALDKLRSQGMKNLIIDLQDNGGGYLSASTDLAELFLPKNETIVFTEGLRQKPQYFRSGNGGADTKSRVVVLVNEYSASASEILSGALQDNDRGVIVGRRTFGKGLVQRPFPFPDGSMIRLTTAHYYTPSGRSIQKPYVKGHGEDYSKDLVNRFEHGELYSADSIRLDSTQVFKTTHLGRTVYGGGGIMPDRFVPLDTTGVNKFFREVRAKNVINQYVVNYVEEHRAQLHADYPDEDAFINKFTVTPDMMTQFMTLAKELGVEDPKDNQFEESKPFIEGNLKGLIGRDLFTPATYYRVMNPMNPIFKEGLRIATTPGEYNKILK